VKEKLSRARRAEVKRRRKEREGGEGIVVSASAEQRSWTEICGGNNIQM
jgi:hypothetical protein